MWGEGVWSGGKLKSHDRGLGSQKVKKLLSSQEGENIKVQVREVGLKRMGSGL